MDNKKTKIEVKSHKEHITARNRYLRYVATIMLWLGISVANYYLLASFQCDYLTHRHIAISV